MKLRFFAIAMTLGLSLACNSTPPAGAPAGAPTTTDTAPAGTVPNTGTAAAPGATTSSAAPAGTPAAASGGNSMSNAAKPGASAGTTASAAPSAPAAPAAPMMMEMEVPAGAALSIVLETPVDSATSHVEDIVKGHMAKAVDVGGMTTIPAGAQVSGTVVEANPSAKVKGRALIALRFNRVIVANTPYTIRTARIVREAEATKSDDAKKVGVGAGAGAIIGAIAGGKKGAAIGGAVGAGAGGGVVLATKGKEVSLGAGDVLATTIEAPVKINAPM